MADVIVASLTEAGICQCECNGPCNKILHSDSLEYARVHFVRSLSMRVLLHMQPASARDLAVL